MKGLMVTIQFQWAWYATLIILVEEIILVNFLNYYMSQKKTAFHRVGSAKKIQGNH